VFIVKIASMATIPRVEEMTIPNVQKQLTIVYRMKTMRESRDHST